MFACVHEYACLMIIEDECDDDEIGRDALTLSKRRMLFDFFIWLCNEWHDYAHQNSIHLRSTANSVPNKLVTAFSLSLAVTQNLQINVQKDTIWTVCIGNQCLRNENSPIKILINLCIRLFTNKIRSKFRKKVSSTAKSYKMNNRTNLQIVKFVYLYVEVISNCNRFPKNAPK